MRLLFVLSAAFVGGLLVLGRAWADVPAADPFADAGVPAVATVAAAPATTAPDTAASGPRPDATWVASQSARTGVPARALTAYAAATLRLATERPGCHLGWTTLAAIGEVESGHGHGTLDASGHGAATIHGPELDGTDGNAAIAESGTWDRARGPMQFIASTWRDWASDGDGDGISDVDDLDDAAYAAARYLCEAGGDLATGAGWTRAVHAYNHSDDYVRAVLAVAQRHAG